MKKSNNPIVNKVIDKFSSIQHVSEVFVTGSSAQRGLLISGDAGTGKSHFVKQAFISTKTTNKVDYNKNITGVINKTANDRPLANYLSEFKNSLYWIMMVAKNVKKIYKANDDPQQRDGDIETIPENENLLEISTLFKKYKSLNILLIRDETTYDENGRFQSLQESKKIDTEIKQILLDNNIPFVEFFVNDNTTDEIFKYIKNIL